MRIVLDTNVVLAGLRSPAGASAELLRRARRRHFTLVMSLTLALDYEALCSRAEHLDAAGLTRAEALSVLNVLYAVAEPVDIKFLWRPQLRDPSDEMVLEAAVNGMAGAIATFNGRDFQPASLFGIDVLRPKAALERITS